MKDCVIIDREVPQWKGNFHMHTDRSWDCTVSCGDALKEYYEKGYQFCAVTDHEVYWDSPEWDRDDFLVLSGVESAFIQGEEPPRWLLEKERWKSLHLNLICDVTEKGGASGFSHGQVLKRPVDYGLDSWNRYIEYCHSQNQLVIFNHPNWSRVDPEIFFGTHGCFAFEIWNTDSIYGGGCGTDEVLWDYCLSRGKKIWALTGDDTHKYGSEHTSCGGAFTMVSTADFTKPGLVRALKKGGFYPSNGPKILDMRIVDQTLQMEFDPAVSVRIVGADYMAKGFTPPAGQTIDRLQWKIKDGLKYFRVQIYDAEGKIAWSQPVFPCEWSNECPILREDPHTPIPKEQSGWQ